MMDLAFGMSIARKLPGEFSLKLEINVVGNSLFMTIGVLVLFGIFVFSGQRLILDNEQITAQSEYIITAVSLAQSVIDEAKMKAFDQQTVGGPVSSRSALTAAGSLGRGGSEIVPVPDTLSGSGYLSATKFNDVDDYNGYTRKVNTPRAAGYNVSVVVKYASETYPDSVKTTQTYCKTLTVTVTHPNIAFPVKLVYPFTY